MITIALTNPDITASRDGMDFFLDIAATHAARLMGEMEDVAAKYLKTHCDLDVSEMNIWALAVHAFMCPPVVIITKPRDIVNAASFHALYDMCVAILDNLPCTNMAVVERLSFLTQKTDIDAASTYIANKVMPILSVGRDNNTTKPIPDPRQIGRAKRIRFLFMESKVPVQTFDSIDHINCQYTHDFFAALAPLREVVYMYLKLVYQLVLASRPHDA